MHPHNDQEESVVDLSGMVEVTSGCNSISLRHCLKKVVLLSWIGGLTNRTTGPAWAATTEQTNNRVRGQEGGRCVGKERAVEGAERGGEGREGKGR